MPKARGGGNFDLNYMFAVHNKETDSGEFFFEFADQVWDNKLQERLQEYGMASVSILTFTNFDGGDSAAAALHRLMQLKELDTVHTHETGVCQPLLLMKVQARREADAKLKDAAAFDEKTQAALKLSLETIAEKIEGIHDQGGQLMQQTSEANQGIKELLTVKAELHQEKHAHETTRRTMQLARDRTEQKLAAKTFAENTKDVQLKGQAEEIRMFNLLNAMLQGRVNEQAASLNTICALRVELGKRARAEPGDAE